MKMLLLMAFVLGVSNGCGPHATGPPFSHLEGPETGKVVVYLYLSDTSASAREMFADASLITRLVSHSYYRYVTVPGQITFSWGRSTRPQDRVIVRASPDTTHFLKLRFIEHANPFGRSGDFELIPVDEESALRELPGLHLILPSDWQGAVWR